MTLFDAGFKDLLFAVARRARRVRVPRGEEMVGRRRRFATSGSFAGHRAWSPGDDLRHVDWNVYARSGELFVKVFEEERRRSLVLVLDRSPSMAAGDPPRFDGARRIAAVLGVAALARVEALYLLDGEAIRSFTGLAAVDALLRALESGTPGTAPREPAGVLALAASDLRGRVVWVSDFAAPDEVERGLALLAPRRADVVGLLPGIPDDTRATHDGLVEIVDPETGRRERIRSDARLRQAVERELALQARRLDDAFRRAGVSLVRHTVPDPFDRRAKAWLPEEWYTWS